MSRFSRLSSLTGMPLAIALSVRTRAGLWNRGSAPHPRATPPERDNPWASLGRRRWPLGLGLALGLTLAIAPSTLAATGGSLDRGTLYAIGLLGLVTLGLSLYLLTVIFQPERF